jgi:hypothetical protein
MEKPYKKRHDNIDRDIILCCQRGKQKEIDGNWVGEWTGDGWRLVSRLKRNKKDDKLTPDVMAIRSRVERRCPCSETRKLIL